MYKRKLMSLEDNAPNVIYTDCDLRNTLLREPSVVDEFYASSVSNPDGSESISYNDPIYILFNQQRIESMGIAAAQQFLDSLQSKSDNLAELRSRCSDDELMMMIKSRHLQSPAEILAWCRYMESNIEKFNSELQQVIQESKTQTTNQVIQESQTQTTNQETLNT